jgi:hypothetical protein
LLFDGVGPRKCHENANQVAEVYAEILCSLCLRPVRGPIPGWKWAHNCGEPIVLLVDPSQPEQNHIEDCKRTATIVADEEKSAF